MVDEPVEVTGEDGFDASGGKALLWVIEDIADHISLVFASCNESDSGGMVDDWVG